MMSFPELEFCHMTTSRTLDLRMYIKPENPKGLPPRHYRHEGLTDKIECFNCSAMKPKSTMNRQWLNGTRSDGM